MSRAIQRAEERDRRLREKLERYLSRMRGVQYDAVKETTDAVIEAISKLPKKATEEQFIKAANDAVRELVPNAFKSREAIRAIDDAVIETYYYFRITDRIVPQSKGPLYFRGPDNRAIGFVGKVDGFFFTKFVDNDTYQSSVKKFLSDEYFARGPALFGRATGEDIDKFKALFHGKLDKLTGGEVERIIDTSVVRMRVWAELEQLDQAKIKGARVVEILETACPLCRTRHNLTFRIDQAAGAVRELTKLSPVQFFRKMYDSGQGRAYAANPAAYLKSKSMNKLLAEGRGLPPYHPHCHGDIVYFE